MISKKVIQDQQQLADHNRFGDYDSSYPSGLLEWTLDSVSRHLHCGSSLISCQGPQAENRVDSGDYSESSKNFRNQLTEIDFTEDREDIYATKKSLYRRTMMTAATVNAGETNDTHPPSIRRKMPHPSLSGSELQRNMYREG